MAGQLDGSTNSALLAIDPTTGKATNLGRIGNSEATDRIQALSHPR